ncbi:uridylate kinase [Defluviimonas sp. 20V17]|uniref:Uridine kinase n=1 Tax=Allgaiera indica TaxID=765699 RepID=A0AAN4UNZ6_9RHOB|nr:uridylate kinase [Allgaiera indica]KDB04303.1 uridylate kinase [Defluviimonas sp. 20V17]GHD99563.1 uridine kinase [Allgaiera indica]SDW22944.1 uridine kinase [Allgaiera indica]
MRTTRKTVLQELARRILAAGAGGPLRVAIDGRTASGKTTLAYALAETIAALGRPVIQTSIDGFHRPRAERYARGRMSAEGYYYDARDLGAVRELLLDPLGPGGDRRYRTASFDLERDQPIDQPPSLAPEEAVLIVDGTFLMRPELAGAWDVTVFLSTTEAEAERRGLGRDADRLGGTAAARRLYAERYRPAFALYDRLCGPRARADIVVDNTDLVRPVLLG